MHDFVPEDMVNFVIEHGTAQVFYAEIGHTTPTMIKGAYYVHGGSDAKPLSGMIIQDPIKNVIYKRSDELQGIMLFNTTVPGEYSFIFANFDSFGTDKTVTLAIHTFEEKNDKDPIEFDFTKEGERIVRGANEEEEAPVKTEGGEDGPLASEVANDSDIGNVRNILRTI